MKRPSRWEGLFASGAGSGFGARRDRWKVYFGAAGVNPSRLRPGSGLGFGLGAFFTSFLPLSLLPMIASVPHSASSEKTGEAEELSVVSDQRRRRSYFSSAVAACAKRSWLRMALKTSA